MNIIRLFLTAAVLLTGSVCSAMTLSATQFINELSLGGVRINMSYDDVIKKYGHPSREAKSGTQLVSKIIYYGDSVQINIDRSQEGRVIGITTTANNGWNTPAGVHVGMKLDEAVKIYGQPSNIREPSQYLKWPTYEYFYSKTKSAGYGLPWELTVNWGMHIGYDKNDGGTIKSIKIWKEEYDPVPVIRQQ